MCPFPEWLDTFVEEKELDPEVTFEIETETAVNLIPVGVVLEHMKLAPAEEQAALQHMLIRLDFHHAEIMPFLAHLAQALAI